MSGINEQSWNIEVCPMCGKVVLTWPFVGNVGSGFFNTPKKEYNVLNNTVYLYDGMTFSNIEYVYCYDCRYKFYKGSIMFDSIIRKAKDAKICRED